MNREALRNMVILYVEDEDDVRTFTSRTLSAITKEVVQAQNGRVGLDIFMQNPERFDLILTDINMPKLNGLDMAMEIKKINKEIPIVVTTAHSDQIFLKKAIDVGINTYAMKPIDLYQLIDSIIKAVEPIHLKKELEKSYNDLQELNLSLEDKITERVKQIQSILDSQDNIIIVTNENKIDSVNKKFLEFFGVDSLDDFTKDHQIICDYFIKENGYFSIDLSPNESWIKHLQELTELERAVKMKNQKGIERIFTVNIDDYEHKGEHFVISFTDITELQQKAQLLEYQANHDSLTGLFNRQKFSSIFGKELRRDRRYENQLSLIMFDIDNFKKVNDSFGHDIGDEILKLVAQITNDKLREHDSVARWGGEEFMVMLPETSLQGAVAVAEKIRVSIENYDYKQLPNVTCSFGVTELKNTDTDLLILKRVDEALYEAKRVGKNKVVTL